MNTSLAVSRGSRRCGGLGDYLSGFLGDGDGASAGATQDRRSRNPTEQQPPVIEAQFGTESDCWYLTPVDGRFKLFLKFLVATAELG